MSATPDSPYKGLAAFGDSELDALLFFGREREIEAVVANVLASRLTVLYGPSGVGKSSLLHAGVARRLRELSGAPVVVHGSWAEDPAGGLTASVRNECGELGPTAGLVDTVAAAAQQQGEIHLLLDQFEEYMLYHGLGGPLSTALPELLRRPGLRVNILLALRDDALAELDEFTGRVPELFGNLLRLDRLDRDAGRAAIVGPLERYGELHGQEFTAEDGLVEAVLGEVSEGRLDLPAPGAAPGRSDRIEAPYLQLVLERLWAHERLEGSHLLRLSTFRAIGGARAVVREHVQGALDRLTLAEQTTAARVVRQLVTPSGRKVSHEARDLAEYADVQDDALRLLLERLGRERIVRGVNGTPGAPTRYEIFHDVLGPPILAWQHEHQLRAERERARRQRRRLRAILATTLLALAVVAAIAAYALVQRSDARTQARHAKGRALAARALAEIPTNPQISVQLALRATELSPGSQTSSVLRSSLLAMRETRILHLGGTVVAAAFAPHRPLLLAGSSDGKVGLYGLGGKPYSPLAREPGLTTAVWSADGRYFATGTKAGVATVWRPGVGTPVLTVSTGAPIAALDFDRTTLLVASGSHVRLVPLGGGRTKTITFPAGIVAAKLDPNGAVFAVAYRLGPATRSELLSARTGRRIRVLPNDDEIHSFAFSPNGKLLVSGSYDRLARIWDARTGRQLHALRHHGYVLDEAFSPGGRSLVTASSDGAGYVWNVASGARELLLVGPAGGADAVAFSPNGSEIALGAADRLARLYYAQDGRLLAPLAGHNGTVTSVGFDPSGRTLVTGSTDGTVRLWQALPAGTLRTIDRRPTPVQSLWAGVDPVTVAGKEARVFSTSGRLARTMRMTAPIVAAAANGRTIGLVDAQGNLLWRERGRRALISGEHITAVAVPRTNGHVLVGRANGDIEYLGVKALLAQAGGPVLGLATGTDRFLVRLATELRVYTYDGTLVSTIHTAAQHAALSPGGLGVATTRGKVAQLWDATTGQLLHTLTGHTSAITDVQYSPDGLDVLTTSFDHTGLIWSARRGKLIRRLIGHFFPVYSGSYSPDGHWIVTASQFTAGLWNAGTGQLVFYLARHKEPLLGAAFSPTGDWVLTGSKDGTARIYRCRICAPLPKLKQLARDRLHAIG